MAEPGVLPEIDDEDPIDTEDGGAIVTLKGSPEAKTPEDEREFYRNLVEDIPPAELAKISQQLLWNLDFDEKAFKDRDKKYREALKRTGLSEDTQGGADFEGASRVVHPMITQACVEFSSRAMKEVFPPGGPVKTQIFGKATPERFEKAERKKAHMNWQLTRQVREFRPELERILTQSPLAGAAYLRLVWNADRRKPAASCATSDRVLLPASATSFYTAERITFVDDITQHEYENRVRSGMYVAAPLLSAPSIEPEKSESQEGRDKIEGKSETGGGNEDGVRRTYECNTYLSGIEELLRDTVDLDENLKAEGDEIPPASAPYLVYVDKTDRRILSIVRNWEEGDAERERLHWLIEWPFVPWEGAHPIGFMQMIGNLSGASTGALRALLDAAHINNIPGAFMLKGSGASGQTIRARAGEVTPVDVGIAADDIRKVIMPQPFGQPSETLFKLLGFLVDAGASSVRMTFDELAEGKTNLPVGTVMALIEQGLTVVSTIMGRMHFAMANTLEVLHRINRMYVTDEEIKDDTGEMLAYRDDYQGAVDVAPVSDPGIPSDAHRFAQMQSVADRAAARPDLYNAREVEKMILERLRLPNPERFLMPSQMPEEMNAVNENVALVMGRPVTAFPEQDHLAHIQVLLDFVRSPLLGQLPIIGPQFLPKALTHLSEHIVLWWASRMHERMSAAAQKDITELMTTKDPEVMREFDRLSAAASQVVSDADLGALKAMPEIIGQAMALIEKFSTVNAPQDPKVAIEAQKVGVQAKAVDIKAQEVAQKPQLAAVKTQSDMQKELLKQAREDARHREEIAAKLQINADDNETAMRIAAAEVSTGERIAVSTGGGINP